MERQDLEDQIQQLQQIDQQKDQFLGQVTHDLRAPLNVVNYLLEEIKKLASDNSQILRNLEMCKCNSNMLMSLINDILDYCQLKENKMKLNLQTFQISQTLVEIQEMMQIQFELRQIKLIFKNQIQCDDNMVYSDQRRLKQVLINLVTNALKFTTTGEVIISAEFFNSDKNLIKFQVQDTGIGIKKERIEVLGLPYTTFNELNLNSSGIGMGLFICKKIIGKLGPTEELFISSEYGVGSKFGFVIFSKIQQSKNTQLYNFKSFFQLTPKSRTRIFSFEKIPIDDQKHRRSFQTELTPSCASKFKKQSKTIMLRKQSSMFVESSSNQLTSFKQWNGNNTSIQCDSFVENQENYMSQEFAQTPEFQHNTPDYYVTKPKKPIKNLKFNKINEASIESFVPGDFSFDSGLIQQDFQQENNKKVIMIADDDIFNQMILESFIKESDLKNIQLIKAFNGMQAQDLFIKYNSITNNELKIAVIIMDCFMPVLDGYTATKHIRELVESGNYYDCAIIAYTGNSGIQEEQKCKSVGFDAYLFKPASKNDLLTAVNKHLNY